MFTENEYNNNIYRGYNPSFVKKLSAKNGGKKAVDDPTPIDANAVEAELVILAEQKALPFWARDIIRDAAIEYDVLPSAMMKKFLRGRAYYARRKAMYEILNCTRILTAGQIGKWFDRDWWTTAFAIASYAADNGKPRLVAFDVDARRARRRSVGARK